MKIPVLVLCVFFVPEFLLSQPYDSLIKSNGLNISLGFDFKWNIHNYGEVPNIQYLRYGERNSSNSKGYGCSINFSYYFRENGITLNYNPVIRYDVIKPELRNFLPQAGEKGWFTDHHLFIKKSFRKNDHINIGLGFSLISPGQGFYDFMVLDTTIIPNHWYALGYYSINFSAGYKINPFNLNMNLMLSPPGAIPYMFNQYVIMLRFEFLYDLVGFRNKKIKFFPNGYY